MNQTTKHTETVILTEHLEKVYRLTDKDNSFTGLERVAQRLRTKLTAEGKATIGKESANNFAAALAPLVKAHVRKLDPTKKRLKVDNVIELFEYLWVCYRRRHPIQTLACDAADAAKLLILQQQEYINKLEHLARAVVTEADNLITVSGISCCSTEYQALQVSLRGIETLLASSTEPLGNPANGGIADSDIDENTRLRGELGMTRQELERIRSFANQPITMSQDGNQRCVLFGTDLQEGVAGFGDTREDALVDFAEHVIAEMEAPPKPFIQHDSDCSTNNRGVPSLLGPCDCSAAPKPEEG